MVMTRVKPRGPFYACRHARTHPRVFVDIRVGIPANMVVVIWLLVRWRTKPVVRLSNLTSSSETRWFCLSSISFVPYLYPTHILQTLLMVCLAVINHLCCEQPWRRPRLAEFNYRQPKTARTLWESVNAVHVGCRMEGFGMKPLL
jgi:hypothetical protein